MVTDVTANDGAWTFLCATWSSANGTWALYQDALLVDEGKGLSKGETIVGEQFLRGQFHKSQLYVENFRTFSFNKLFGVEKMGVVIHYNCIELSL